MRNTSTIFLHISLKFINEEYSKFLRNYFHEFFFDYKLPPAPHKGENSHSMKLLYIASKISIKQYFMNFKFIILSEITIQLEMIQNKENRILLYVIQMNAHEKQFHKYNHLIQCGKHQKTVHHWIYQCSWRLFILKI